MEFKSASTEVGVKTSEGIENYTIEERKDPLSGYSSVVCGHLLDKWSNFYGRRDEEYTKKFVEESKKNCFFCRPKIDKVAARFLKTQMDDEILKYKFNGSADEEVYIFPNIYPRFDFDAVATMPEKHFLNLNEFKAGMLEKFLSAEIGCIKKAYDKNKNLIYANIGSNYLFTSGASLTHLHMQIAMRNIPFTYTESLVKASEEYSKKTGRDYWEELKEKNTEREIYRNGKIYVYAPYAPQGFSEIRGIVSKPNLKELDEYDIKELSGALEKILNFYHMQGFQAYNLIIHSDKINSVNSKLPVNFRICVRPNPRENYTSIDTWFMPFLMQETIVLEKPEETAEKIRKNF